LARHLRQRPEEAAQLVELGPRAGIGSQQPIEFDALVAGGRSIQNGVHQSVRLGAGHV
jgi:hypothetical protein